MASQKKYRGRSSEIPWVSLLRRALFIALVIPSTFYNNAALSQSQIVVQSPEQIGIQCPVCPEQKTRDVQTNQDDFTCQNPVVKQNVGKDVDTCLGCSMALREQAAKCGMFETCDSCCPELPKTACRITSCPAGQSLWDKTSPNCRCESNSDICSKLGGRLRRSAWYESTSTRILPIKYGRSRGPTQGTR